MGLNSTIVLQVLYYEQHYKTNTRAIPPFIICYIVRLCLTRVLLLRRCVLSANLHLVTVCECHTSVCVCYMCVCVIVCYHRGSN
jgi:hypothetical protein